MSEEDKNEALTDLTEVAFTLATTLRILEVFTETAVEVAQATGGGIDFSQVALMILSMRMEGGPLTDKAQATLDHPRVSDYIATTVAKVAMDEFGIDLNAAPGVAPFQSDEGLQEIIDAIEAALDNGELTLDTLSKYL